MADKQKLIQSISKNYKELENLIGLHNLATQPVCNGRSNNPEKNKDIPRLGELIRTNFDELLTQIPEESEEYKKVHLLRAFILFLEMQTLDSKDPTDAIQERNFSLQLIRWTKNYGEKPEGFRMYFHAQLMLAGFLQHEKNYKEALQKLLECEMVYQNYLKNFNECDLWGGDHHLKYLGLSLGPYVRMFDRTLTMNYSLLASGLYHTYLNLSPPDNYNAVRYAVPKIKYASEFGIPMRRSYIFINESVEVLDLMISEGCFKQVDHILAVGMHQAVLNSHDNFFNNMYNAEYDLQRLKGQLSFRFALWGVTIFRRSMDKIKGATNVQKTRNELYEEFPQFMEDGYKVYASQFPIDLVTDKKELKKIFYRAKKWAKRADTLMGANKCGHMCCLIENIHILETEYFSKP